MSVIVFEMPRAIITTRLLMAMAQLGHANRDQTHHTSVLALDRLPPRLNPIKDGPLWESACRQHQISLVHFLASTAR